MGPYLEIERRIAALAASQDGVVRHDQPRALGLSQKAAWGLRGGGSAVLDVTVPARSAVRRPGTRMHVTTRTLETTRLDLLPITTPARTMLDLAGSLTIHQLEATMKQAEILQVLDVGELRAVIDAHPRHPGRRRLLALLARAEATELTLTLSDLEVRFAALCDGHRLPRPAVNARPLGWRVDFLWPARRLVVETDGWRTHRTRSAFEEDRGRDQALVVAGYRVVRFTHRQIVADPADVAATLSALLID